MNGINKKSTGSMSRLLFITIFYAIIALMSTLPAAASITETIVLNNEIHQYDLGKRVDYLEDKTGKMDIDDILSNEPGQVFTRSTMDKLNFGFTGSVYWIRFRVKNENREINNYLLEAGYPHLDDIVLYFIDEEGNRATKTGSDRRTFKEREVLHRNFIFKFNILRGEEKTVYMRVRTNSSFQVPLNIWEPVAFAEKVNREQTGLGIYYGIILVMILYNLFIFFGIRDKTYLYYVIFIFIYANGQLSLNGLGFEYVWSDYPLVWNKSVVFSLILGFSGI
ncbi:MAG: hypothetical protein GY754_17550, partial [bacterium]|nr:hypothetical protein [bacterium]